MLKLQMMIFQMIQCLRFLETSERHDAGLGTHHQGPGFIILDYKHYKEFQSSLVITNQINHLGPKKNIFVRYSHYFQVLQTDTLIT